ncbi:MAG: DUF393 domain-containing protein [Acidobacteria bacterium]|nr:DUF393 domain-containing protein [Acidobacteriota bacterium]
MNVAGTRPDEPALVLFDGPCVLCQRSVRTIARFDTRRTFQFASLDSATGRRALEAAGWPVGERSSVVLVEGGAAWTKSEAALRIARRLRFPLSALAALRVVPRPLRDAVYDWVARHRYRWFGRTDACALLPADVRERVIRE